MNQKFSTNRNEKGQGLVEYVLLSSVLGLVLAGTLMAFGPEIKVVSRELAESMSGGFSSEGGVVYIPGLSPTHTATSLPTLIGLPTLTDTPIPTNTLVPTETLVPTDTPAPTELACTSGSATNVRKEKTCRSLRDVNNCEHYEYDSDHNTCSWY